VNVDFQDVRTAMGEMGRAMMGSAEAAGLDRARIAAEQAVGSPLLEGTELSGARCVLINITAAKGSLKLAEVKEAVHTVQAFAAQEAFVKYGTVFDDNMEDRLRVTVVATGLGSPRSTRQEPQPSIRVIRGTGTHGPIYVGANDGYDDSNNIATPAVIRNSHRRARAEPTMGNAVRSGGGSVGAGTTYDIPAFLRRQAD
ncbi:MAG: cell division protein FtsZ, partial [Proteobacteria bacterium]|nr:cell division protein FtsZ [Pseudomonadota bacterium]